VRDDISCVEMKDWRLFGDENADFSSILKINVVFDESLCLKMTQDDADCTLSPSNERALSDISVVLL